MKNILLIRTDRLGDVILTLPMLSAIRRSVPDARISMLLSSYAAQLLSGNREVEEVLLYDNSSSLVPLLDLVKSLKNRGFDSAIVVHPTLRLAILVFLARIPIRVGSGYRWYSFLFNHKVFEHRRDARRHEVEYNLNLLNALGIHSSFTPEFPLEVSGSSAETIRRLCDDYSIEEGDTLVLVHPGSGGSARDWSPKNFGKFANRCVAELKAMVIITGGKGEEGIAQEVIDQIPRGAINLVGKLELPDLVALIKRADLFVSNSTGPLHIAAALGTSVIGLYPPIRECSPERWGPYTTRKRVFVPDRNLCARCEGRECEASDCMEQISADEVFLAARELMMSVGKQQNREAHAQRVAR